MHLEKSFDVDRPRDAVVELLCQDATLLSLFPSGDTEIVDTDGDHKTTRTRYRALGREGVATFEFTFLLDGNVRFEKVCDGRVWRALRGDLSVEEQGERSRVRLALEGRTKSLVPEFTIKGPLEEQLSEMTAALRERLEL